MDIFGVDNGGMMTVWNPDVEREYPEPKLRKGEKLMRFENPKPPVMIYSYSNQNSQGALITETSEFPAGWIEPRQKMASAYSDRMASWDYDRFNRACELVGSGD